MQLLGCLIIICLVFIRNGWTIFQIGYIILYSVQQCMDCLIFPHTAFSAITIFPFNQCKECIEIAHWGFNLQLLDSNWCYYLPWAYLPCQYCLYCNIYICLFPFLKFDFFSLSWLLSFESSLYVLDTILLADMRFANILSQLEVCSTILLKAKSRIWWGTIYQFFLLWIMLLISGLSNTMFVIV